MAYLIEDLITSVKDRSFVPISQTTFQDADILRILNEELSLKLTADLVRAREDFFLARKTYAIQASEDRYLVPKRSIGNTVKGVFYVDTAGNTSYPLPRIDVDRIAEFSPSGGNPERFYFEGDELVVLPKPLTAIGSLMVSFARKPNTLVLTSSVTKITATSTSGTDAVFTVDTDLTSTVSVGSQVDFLRAESPFCLWASEISVSAVTSTSITVALSSVADVDGSTIEPGVGDYISLTGEANIPMIPIEFHPILAEMACVRMLRSMGDLKKWQASKAELEQMRQEALGLIRQRAESAPDKASGFNPLVNAFRSRW